MKTKGEKDEALPFGITRVDTACPRKGILRLGPPPKNRQILVQGGLGWFLGKKERPRPEGIIKTNSRSSPDEVAVAFAREMAWRWVTGRYLLTGQVRRKVLGRTPHYAQMESSFVSQALRFPGRIALEISEESAASEREFSSETRCVCGTESACCAGGCVACQEG